MQSIDPEFAQFPVTSSHWRSTPLVTHDEPPFGVPGALVTTRPPLMVRLIRVCWLVMKNWPFVRNDGFEFITQPLSEQPANTDRALKFSVPERDVALPWMTPVSAPDTLEDPPFLQASGGGLNDSLNCTEHDVPDALHCWVMDGASRRVGLIMPA